MGEKYGPTTWNWPIIAASAFKSYRGVTMKSLPIAPNVRHNRSRLARIVVAFWMLFAVFLCTAGVPSLAGSPSEVPSISAGLGTCTADFTVVDAASKPMFNAKIHVKFAYGFMSKRNTELQVGTDSNGKAHVEGLPNKLKKPPLEYTIQSGDLTKTVTNDPAADCHPHFDVTLQ